jgi:hypothetical protein
MRDEQAELYGQYSDAHKEVYGVRARFAWGWSVEDLRAGLDQLAEESEAMFSAPAEGHGWSYEGDLSSLEF